MMENGKLVPSRLEPGSTWTQWCCDCCGRKKKAHRYSKDREDGRICDTCFQTKLDESSPECPVTQTEIDDAKAYAKRTKETLFSEPAPKCEHGRTSVCDHCAAEREQDAEREPVKESGGRVWTVYDGHTGSPRLSGPNIAYAENIHVIEYSAFEQIKRELEQFKTTTVPGYQFVKRQLENENAKLTVRNAELTADNKEMHAWKDHAEIAFKETLDQASSDLEQALSGPGMTIAALEKGVSLLRSLLEIGKRDMTNPKYDSYFDDGKKIIADLTSQGII